MKGFVRIKFVVDRVCHRRVCLESVCPRGGFVLGVFVVIKKFVLKRVCRGEGSFRECFCAGVCLNKIYRGEGLSPKRLS